MMKKFITMFAALVLSAVMIAVPTMAQAVSGDKGFYYGTEAEQRDLNNVLARLVRVSLDKDQNGNARLSESNCREKGGCGTPRLLVDSFRQMKGLPPIDLSNLAEFLESLEADENRGGYYDVTSLRPDPKALGGFRAVMDGVQRGFNLGEKAWSYHDKKNNRKIVVLMGHCANPVYRLIPIPIIGVTLACVTIQFTTKPGDITPRFVLTAPAGITISEKDECLALKRAGSTVYERWTDYCATVRCNFSAPTGVLGTRVLVVGSFEVKQHGTHTLRLPAYVAEKDSPYVTLLCLDRVKMEWPELPSGQYTMAQVDRYTEERGLWITGHSDTVGVRWHDYREVSDRKEAIVYYSASEVPVGLTASQAYLQWHWGEYFRMHPEQLAR